MSSHPLRLLAWFLLFAATSLLAQSSAGSGRIDGTIYDPSGAAVPTASVAAVNEATGISTEQKSDSKADDKFRYTSICEDALPGQNILGCIALRA